MDTLFNYQAQSTVLVTVVEISVIKAIGPSNGILMTVDRIIHGLVGLVFVALFATVFKRRISYKGYALITLTALLGTWVPDWDLWLDNGYQRSPLTHSALPALLFVYPAFNYSMVRPLMIGLCLGLASHLFCDIVFYGNVVGLPGGNNDRLFLLVNTVVLVLGSSVFTKAFNQSGVQIKN